MKSTIWFCLFALLMGAALPAKADDQQPPQPGKVKVILLKMSRRLLEVRRDTNIEQIIQANNLSDSEMVADLDDKKSLEVVKNIAIGLYQASSAKSDLVATQLMKEFQITVTPTPPAKSPPAN